MTKVSRKPLDFKVKQELIKKFWYALGKLNTQEVESFLKEILSPTEIAMIVKRLEILKQLRLRFDYENIRKTTNVTDATIAKMSEKLQSAGREFLKILDNLIFDEKRQSIKGTKNINFGKFVGGYKLKR